MKSCFLSLALALVFTTCLAQHADVLLRPAAASAAGFDEKALTRIDSLLQYYVREKWIGGATAFIAKDGKIVWYKGIGYHDADKKTPIAKDEIFRVASQTKAITSVAVMMLYEEGKFMLDDAVSKYIPEFEHPVVLQSFNKADTSYTTIPAKREITIRDLLTHTSGIHYAQIGNDTFNAIYGKNHLTSGIGCGKLLLANEIKRLAKLPLSHQPGERFTYGLNTDVLGYLVEVVSGTTFDKFLQKRIFEPLGMMDTYFFLPKAKQGRLTTLNAEDAERKIKAASKTFEKNGSWITDYPNTGGTYFSGGGGLSSTAYDYSLFMQMILNGGTYNNHRLLSPTSVKMMTMNQTQLAGVTNNDFGLGLGITNKNTEAQLGLPAGSYTWGGMFSSSYWIDPTQHIVAQLFINQYPMSHGEIHNKFKALVYAALK